MVSLLLLLMVSLLSSSQGGPAQKYAAYECGYGSLMSLDSVLSSRFYLTAMLFLLFDLELVLLLPALLQVLVLSMGMLLSMLTFLLVLLLGFLYEWCHRALSWS
nr:NADH dehydrogenase subunit 3 [Bangiopsis subsimplex]